jgi:hypothetical protein
LINSAVKIGAVSSVKNSLCNLLKRRNKVAAGVVEFPSVDDNVENENKA